MRSCGDCSLCCKLPRIEFGPDGCKAAGEWCEQCVPGRGCSLYDDRPEVCRRFSCLWLTDDGWPESHSPRKCGCVVLYEDSYVRVLEDVRGASSSIGAALMRISMAGLPVHIVFSDASRAVVWDQDCVRHTVCESVGKSVSVPMISSRAFIRSFGGNIKSLKHHT